MSKELSMEQLLQQQREVNKKLLEIQKRTPAILTSATVDQTPANEAIYDLYWQGDSLYLELELPGVSEDDISVDLTPSYLRITGKVAEINNRETTEILICKRRQGTFEYLFNLPTAQMRTPRPPQLKNGVLFLQLQVFDDSEND